MSDELLTVREVAQRLKVTEQTVRHWIRDGKLKGARLGGDRTGWRIRESEVERLVREAEGIHG